MVTVFGIHDFSEKSCRHLHDASAAIIKDGKIVTAVNEERFSRRKNEGAFPHQSIESAPRIANLKPKNTLNRQGNVVSMKSR